MTTASAAPSPDGAVVAMRHQNAMLVAMETFVMLTQLAPGSLHSPPALEDLERDLSRRVREHCPEIEWIANFAVLGAYDYVDIFRAPDVESATKLAALVRTFGHAHTELWPAIHWKRFKEIIRNLPEVQI